MIVEFPGQPKAGRHMGAQRFHSNLLGGVVSGVDDVDLELHGVEVGMVGTLARNEGVEASGTCRPNPRPGGPRDHANRPDQFRTSRHQARSRLEQLIKSLDQLGPADTARQRPPHPDVDPLVSIERRQLTKSNRPGKDDVVANLRMDVERDVR